VLALFAYDTLFVKRMEHSRRFKEVATELLYRTDKATAALESDSVSSPVGAAKKAMNDQYLLPKFAGWSAQALLYELNEVLPSGKPDRKIDELKRDFPFDDKAQVSERLKIIREAIDKNQ
jgi:hypothetical protein